MKRLILCFCLLSLGCLSSINTADAMQTNGHRPLTQNETKLFNAVEVGIPDYGFYNPGASYHEGQRSRINELLALPDVDVCAQDNDGKTVLHHVAMINPGFQNDHKAISYFISHNNNVANIQDNNGNTAVHCAVIAGGSDVDMLRELLNNPAVDLNIRNNNGDTPLMLAIRNRDSKRIKLLLQCPTCDVSININGHTLLTEFASWGSGDIVNALLTHPGIRVNEQDDQRRTPLYIAVEKGNVAVVNALLAHPGIMINWRDNQDRTPLYIAVEKGNIAVVNALLAHPGIMVNWRDNQDRTPLYIAVEKGNVAVVNALLAHPGIMVNWTNNQGRTPLTIARNKNNPAIIAALLAHGAR